MAMCWWHGRESNGYIVSNIFLIFFLVIWTFLKLFARVDCTEKLFLNLTHDTHTNKFGADIELSNAKDHGVYMCWLNVYVAV